MADVQTSAGTVLSVSATAPATYDQAGFAALTFTTIGEITDMGEFGKTYNLVTHQPLATRRTVKRKGSFNDGALSLQLARVPDDVGQVVLQAGLDSDDSYSFKVVLQDGEIQYFSGQVMSYTNNVGSADQISGSAVSIEIDNDIISG
tara:strand:+ start:1536 stop:1976 length:441 start_codon:yes stop_codon:yes gene_type:complete